jgi:predicted PurR-regulated permease PerM
MKKKVYLLSTALMLAFSTSQLSAATVVTEPVAKEITLTDAQKEAKLQAIKERVEEIKAMDKSQLTKEQKQEVKAELKTMKTEAKALGGGVYLSVGAIIIIILLLILIL